MLEHVTGVLRPLTEHLKKVELDIASCIRATSEVIQQLSDMREGAYWDNVFKEIELLAKRMGVSITVPRKRTINQYSVPLSEKLSDHYTLIWKACLNNVIADI